MTEKRKPEYTFLLKKQSKKYIKIELYPSRLWGDDSPKFRVRKDGVWFPKGVKRFYYKTEFINMMLKNVTAY